ncbi:MAG: thiamine-phosphate kinase [Bdellovibrionaceae bacterium]|nr:thiamine-phosphate kinase [Pseudobdellovibrionaceae bacterium]
MSDEFQWISRIRQAVASSNPHVHVGIGDDAAVCESPSAPLLLCSDAMVEGVHFRLDWSTPEDVGHKALASTLSDIAAMNGQPLYALVSLALRPGLDESFLDPFYAGLLALAKRHHVQLVGGDLVRSRTETFVDVTVIGHATHPVTRAGARPGDLLLVSGPVGASRAGLFALEHGLREADSDLLRAHHRPEPRFDLLAGLSAPGLLTAMIDISDGLASELHHLSRASQCGFEVIESRLPLHPGATALATQHAADAYDWAWSGGEDYQLLMTVDPSIWSHELEQRPELGVQLTEIGRATPAATGLTVHRRDGRATPLPDSGWNHFRR